MNRLNISKKGIVLFSVLGIVVIFLLIIIPLVSWSINEFNWTLRSYNSLRALNLADAGAELAVYEVIHNGAGFAGWGAGWPKTTTQNNFTDGGGEVAGDIEISVENPTANTYLITSTGYVPSKASAVVSKTVKVRVFPYSLFNNGVYGYNSVYMHGNAEVDSYDSNDGPYDPTSPGYDADVGTNGSMTFEDNSVIAGDIFIGPSGSIIGVIPGRISGEIYYAGEEVESRPEPDVSGLVALATDGDLSVAGGATVLMTPGDHRYESITVDGNKFTILQVPSNTRIYVHNDFIVGGQARVETDSSTEVYIAGTGTFAGNGIVNSTQNPTNLQIYGIGASSVFTFEGNSAFYGTFYGPNSEVNLGGNNHFFGACFGETVELYGNIKFHYDESLQYEGPFAGYDIAYWQEK